MGKYFGTDGFRGEANIGGTTVRRSSSARIPAAPAICMRPLSVRA